MVFHPIPPPHLILCFSKNNEYENKQNNTDITMQIKKYYKPTNADKISLFTADQLLLYIRPVLECDLHTY